MAHPYNDRASGIDERGIRPPAAFSVEAVVTTGGVLVLALAGELDMASAGTFRAAVDRAFEADERRGVVIDLGETEFMDSSMLKELLRAHAELQARDCELVLCHVGQTIKRLLDLTGTAAMLRCEKTREAALARLAP